MTWGRLSKSHCCATKVADLKLEMTLLMLDFIGHVMTLQIQSLNLAVEDYMDIFSIYNTIHIWNVVECDEAKKYMRVYGPPTDPNFWSRHYFSWRF